MTLFSLFLLFCIIPDLNSSLDISVILCLAYTVQYNLGLSRGLYYCTGQGFKTLDCVYFWTSQGFEIFSASSYFHTVHGILFKSVYGLCVTLKIHTGQGYFKNNTLTYFEV